MNGSQSSSAKPQLSEVLWACLWLGGVAALIALATQRIIPGIERTILTDVQKAISPIVSSPVMVSVHGRQTTISGQAADETERAALIAAIQDADGVRTVVDRLTVESASSIATNTGDEVPTAELSSDEVPLVAVPSNAPTTETALTELEPEAAPNEDALTTATPEVAAVADSSDDVEPLPTMSLAVVDGALSIDGQMDASVDIRPLIQAALQTFEPDYLTNRIDTSSETADAEWLQPLAALLPQLADLESPSIDITDRQISLAGVAATREDQDTVIGAALEALRDFSLVERIEVTEPEPSPDPVAIAEPTEELAEDPEISEVAALQVALADLEDTRIQFLPNSDVFADGSADRLDAIAAALKRHDNTRVEIEGHTDTSGNTADNMRLSQQRAITVREALVDRGIERSRLVAYGYGEGIPLADNSTPEGRALNRRIEFTITTPEEQQ